MLWLVLAMRIGAANVPKVPDGALETIQWFHAHLADRDDQRRSTVGALTVMPDAAFAIEEACSPSKFVRVHVRTLTRKERSRGFE